MGLGHSQRRTAQSPPWGNMDAKSTWISAKQRAELGKNVQSLEEWAEAGGTVGSPWQGRQSFVWAFSANLPDQPPAY